MTYLQSPTATHMNYPRWHDWFVFWALGFAFGASFALHEYIWSSIFTVLTISSFIIFRAPRPN